MINSELEPELFSTTTGCLFLLCTRRSVDLNSWLFCYTYVTLKSALILFLDSLFVRTNFTISVHHLYCVTCAVQNTYFFNEKWAIPGIFLFIFVFSIQLTINKQMFNVNFADDWSRTEDLWYWKRPLYQLSHNHFPKNTYLWFPSWSLSYGFVCFHLDSLLFASWLVEMWNAFISSLKTFGSFWTLITKICYLNLILTQLDALKPQSHILLCNDSYVNWSSYTQQWQQFKASNCTGRHPGGLLFPPLDPDGKPVRVERQVGVVWRWRTVWPLHPRLHVSPIFLLHGLAQGNLNSSGILWLVNTFANHFAFLHQRLFNLICA